MTNWDGINEFVAAAETNNFTKAAEKLSTSVANVSRRVSALEERLAVKLFNRTTRKVHLTEAGLIYFDHCKKLVDGLENADLSINEMQSTPKGLIKLTAPVTYGEQYIAPIIVQFLKRYPHIEVDLILTNKKLDLIDDNIDIALRLGVINDSSLMSKKLASRQLYVCASAEYIRQNGRPTSLNDLKQHQCLVGSVETWRFKEEDKEKSIKIAGRLKCNNGPTLLKAAKNHLGLVQLPDYYVKEELENGALIEVLKRYRAPLENIWALYSQNQHLSPKIRKLIDFLSNELPKISI